MKPTPKLTDAADDILAAALEALDAADDILAAALEALDAADDILAAALGVLAVAREARNALEARNAAADAVVARYAVRLARRRQGTV